MQLNKVVFPEPLGPMTPTISPGRTSSDRSLIAVSPPNCTVRCRTVRRSVPLATGSDLGRQTRGDVRFFGSLLVTLFAHPRATEETLRPDEGERDHGRTEGQHSVARRLAEELGQRDEDGGPEDHAGQAPRPADYHDAHHQDRLGEREALWGHEARPPSKESPGETGEGGAEAEREELRPAHVYSHGACGQLVLADRLPGEADA